jgi:hypothetical protein
VPGGERTSISITIDVQDGRPVGLTRAQEVAVERMQAPVRRDGESGGASGLGRDLAAEEPRSTYVILGVLAAEDVAVELLDVEEVQELGDVARLRFAPFDRVLRAVHGPEP